ncbi:hypothetical protein CHGG_06533 [Chaetomium globosum CBS 148.51]|uniref:Complex 1 LYR protein domain-containing protein n=1 Tax=Chaetomium globosum (strain ATCC 6205 / CBS 148.51 / DSM 1962 / NBRC 6347 / NRRL 1970) TaxID=306901 RepID=Q2H482_CHAGB|nr:uncharacterized protein CHGG_06533 [Chaetomium globosum CBS 148.51]EAQ89914.1 hypothetical protein CHGG_06533 [Chaetomium globosum CBS 148.51]
MSAVQAATKPETAQKVLSLLLRQGNQFSAYNFREYALRRTRDAFRENRSVEDPRKVQELVQKGLKELQVLKACGGGRDIGQGRGGPRRDDEAEGYRALNQDIGPPVCRDAAVGLPVRQWRQEWVSVAPSSQQEMTQQGDRWAVELPYGMPRESHLLPPHTQELLRAARSGRLYKRPAPIEDEELDAELDVIKGEKKDSESANDAYMVKLWKQVPRNAESQTISHLAKRHKNTVTLASKAMAPQAAGPTVIRATIRRMDAAGNPYEQTITLADGQQVDGEIISTTVVPAPAAAQGDLAVQQTTPVRRRPPPPKRKPKGVGRGRKKGRLPLPLPATRSHATTVDGTPSVKTENVGPDVSFHFVPIASDVLRRPLTLISKQGIKIEETEDSTNQDSEMADISNIPSDDEESEGGEGEDEEEGDKEAADDDGSEAPKVEDANGEARIQEVKGSEMSETIQPSSVEEPDEPRPAVEEVEEITIPKVRFQPPTLTNLGSSLGFTKIEGSPLKNVMILSPTEPSSMIPPTANTSFAAANYLEVQSRTLSMDMGSGGAINQAYTAETTTRGILPPLRDNAGLRHAVNQNIAGTITQQTAAPLAAPPQAPALEPMVATTTTTTTTVPITSPADQLLEPQPAAVTITTAKTQSPPIEPVPLPAPPIQPSEEKGDETTEVVPDATPALEPPASPALAPMALPTGDDEDDGLNLLGSLERELDRQEGVSSGSSEEEEGKAMSFAGPPTEPATVEEKGGAEAEAGAGAEETGAKGVVGEGKEDVVMGEGVTGP